MKVIPINKIDNEGVYLSITTGKEYEVLGIEANCYRVLNDPEAKPTGNEPLLFSPDCFTIINDNRPNFWKCEIGDENEEYCYPKEWTEIGFFEDYHDGNETIINIFWECMKKYYPETFKERFE